MVFDKLIFKGKADLQQKGGQKKEKRYMICLFSLWSELLHACRFLHRGSSVGYVFCYISAGLRSMAVILSSSMAAWGSEESIGILENNSFLEDVKEDSECGPEE